MASLAPQEGGFLATLSPGVRTKVVALGERFRFCAGQTIFREGDASRYLYIVWSGRVSIDLHVPSKGRTSIMTVEAGEVFSWSALAEPGIETAAARAVEDTELLGLPGEPLKALCQEDTRVGFELYRSLTTVIATRLLATRLQCLDIFETA
jgi:CRP-like cAMP-binding protein